MERESNCGESDCPACLGDMNTLSPAYADATDHDKAIWFNCRQAAFKARDAEFHERSLESMNIDLAKCKAREAEIIAIIGDVGEVTEADREAFTEDMDKAVSTMTLMLERMSLMFEMMHLNRHIGWKLAGGIPEDAYREMASVN